MFHLFETLIHGNSKRKFDYISTSVLICNVIQRASGKQFNNLQRGWNYKTKQY